MKKSLGFSLIELAIVLVIITLLVGGLAGPLATQLQARRVSETERTLGEARDAVMGYAMTHRSATGHPYLPCPDVDGDGREDRVGKACRDAAGYFPWVDLASAAQDVWGNRLRYAVEPGLGHAATGFSAATAQPSPPESGWNQVATANGCANVDVAAGVPFLVLSHGANGWGSRSASGSMLAAPTSADEQENLDGDACHVARVPGRPGDAAGEFDDLVTWLSFGVLVSRVCPDGCP